MPEIDNSDLDTQKNKNKRTYKPRKKLSDGAIKNLTEAARKRDRSKHPWKKRNKILGEK